MHRLVCAFVIRIWHKTHFLMARLKFFARHIDFASILYLHAYIGVLNLLCWGLSLHHTHMTQQCSMTSTLCDRFETLVILQMHINNHSLGTDLWLALCLNFPLEPNVLYERTADAQAGLNLCRSPEPMSFSYRYEHYPSESCVSFIVFSVTCCSFKLLIMKTDY